MTTIAAVAPGPKTENSPENPRGAPNAPLMCTWPPQMASTPCAPGCQRHPQVAKTPRLETDLRTAKVIEGIGIVVDYVELVGLTGSPQAGHSTYSPVSYSMRTSLWLRVVPQCGQLPIVECSTDIWEYRGRACDSSVPRTNRVTRVDDKGTPTTVKVK